MVLYTDRIIASLTSNALYGMFSDRRNMHAHTQYTVHSLQTETDGARKTFLALKPHVIFKSKSYPLLVV